MVDEPKPPLNLLLYTALVTVLGGIIIPGTPKSIQYAFIPVVGLISYHLIVNTSTGSIIVDAGLGCMLLIQPLMHFANVLLVDPDSLVEHSNLQPGRITEKPWLARVLWTIRRDLNTRGVGWKHEPHGLRQSDEPNAASTSRWTFVQRVTRRMLRNALISGAGFATMTLNPALRASESLSSAPVLWQIPAVLSCGSLIYSGMDNIFNTIALCFVIGGLSTPEKWPRMFGSVLDAWSVSRFWSVTWHQMLRRFLTVYATSLTRLLHQHQSPLETRSLAVTVVWIWTVFTLSGFVHIGGEYMATRRLLLHGGIFRFFLIQPVAIILERTLFPRMLSSTSNRLDRPRPSFPWRIFGYTWVVLWFTWGFVPVIDVYKASGIFTGHPLDDLMNVRWKEIWQVVVGPLGRRSGG